MPVQRTRVVLSCEQCAKPFERTPSEIARGVSRFCSNRCSADSRPKPVADDVWKYGERTESGCLVWTRKARTKGYGSYRLDGRAQLVHRIAWMLTHGPIPPGLGCLHRCDNPPCFEPSHLFLGTQRDNGQDMSRKGRQWLQKHPDRVKRGGDFVPPPGWTKRGESNCNAVLTEAAVLDIRQRRADGEQLKAIAAHYGVSRDTVFKVVRRIYWKHV